MGQVRRSKRNSGQITRKIRKIIAEEMGNYYSLRRASRIVNRERYSNYEGARFVNNSDILGGEVVECLIETA